MFSNRVGHFEPVAAAHKLHMSINNHTMSFCRFEEDVGSSLLRFGRILNQYRKCFATILYNGWVCFGTSLGKFRSI